uniref:Uncharacterized protein n=1 Tax=Setaria italica TaxID=4555 RepID=K3Z085_SETIT
MKIAWGKNAKTKRQPVVVSTKPGLPFGVESDTEEAEKDETAGANTNCPGAKPLDTAESLQHQGDKLAEEGKYHEALSRWEAALTLAPDNAVLYEQKAQPDHDDAKADRETAARLVKKRGQLHSSGLSANKRRFTVGEKENSDNGAEGEEKADETAVQSG